MPPREQVPRSVAKFLVDGVERSYYSPRTREELARFFKLFFGFQLARKAVCAHHQAPLDAVWAAYQAVDPVVVWEASRGFGGKCIAADETVVLPATGERTTFGKLVGRPGVQLLSPAFSTPLPVPVQVSDNGVEPVHRVTLDSGITLDRTAHHTLLAAWSYHAPTDRPFRLDPTRPRFASMGRWTGRRLGWPVELGWWPVDELAIGNWVMVPNALPVKAVIPVVDTAERVADQLADWEQTEKLPAWLWRLDESVIGAATRALCARLDYGPPPRLSVRSVDQGHAVRALLHQYGVSGTVEAFGSGFTWRPYAFAIDRLAALLGVPGRALGARNHLWHRFTPASLTEEQAATYPWDANRISEVPDGYHWEEIVDLDRLPAVPTVCVSSPLTHLFCAPVVEHNTTALAGLAMLELLDGADVVVLGGSARQSKRVHEAEAAAWNHVIEHPDKNGTIQRFATPLRELLAGEPTSYYTRTKRGNSLLAITASSKSVRGPHPQRLRCDEVDEMDLAILDAALGQPLSARGIREQTVLASTHQYQDGTFSEALARAQENGWPVFRWCVPAETLVLGPRGEQAVRDLCPGDVIYAYDGDHFVQTRLGAVWSTGVKRTVVVQTTGGELECTADHRVLTDRGWVPAGRLRVGARVVTAALPSAGRGGEGEASQSGDSLRPRYASVVAVTAGRDVEVWDVSVPVYHNFVANGFVVHNCYRESLVGNGGWLPASDVERKRVTIAAYMWQVEYELQAPEPGTRLFSGEVLETLFARRFGVYEEQLGRYYELDKPQAQAKYATGADWAQDRDYTVIVTLRIDVSPVRLVAYERLQKLDWSFMAGRLDARVRRYPGVALHDGNGPGAVLKDYLEEPAVPYNPQGRARTRFYGDYLLAVEHGRVIAPSLSVLEAEHRALTSEMLFGGGHPPDTVVAMAMAWSACQGTYLEEPARQARPGRVLPVRAF